MSENYYNENDGNLINRIVIYSPNDTLILNDCTMKSGIARYVIKNYIMLKDIEKNITVKSKENCLDLIFNSTEKNLFLEKLHDYSLIQKIHQLHQKLLGKSLYNYY